MQAILSSILMRVPFLKSEGAQQTLVYFLAIFILFSLLAAADRLLVRFDDHRVHLYMMMASVVLLGTVNVWILNQPRYGNVPAWMRGLLTISANVVGATIFLLISWKTAKPYYDDLIFPALLLFALPWFFSAALKGWLAIPSLDYVPLKVYDLRDIIGELNWGEDENRGIIWAFENLSEMEAQGSYRVRTHTPHAVLDIPLERLFKGLLSLHNHNLCPEQPISFESRNQVFGWRFFARKSFLFWKWRKPLDPRKTFRQNVIRFRLLSKTERQQVANLRKQLSPKFKTTHVYIVRVTEA